jgi:hypothetical protein
MKQVAKAFEEADNIKELFEVVKDAVRLTIKESRDGLDIGLMELGNDINGLLSAFYQVGSNIIVLNKTPIRRIGQTDPQMMKPYIFVVLLHEYLHSLGYIDEKSARNMTHEITQSVFGEKLVTDMAKDLSKYFPFLLYPGGHPAQNDMQVIEMDDINYIG